MTDNKYTIPLTCTHCGNKTPMLVVAKYNRTNAYEPENTNPFDVTTSWEIILCPACDRVLFGEGYWHSILSDGSASVGRNEHRELRRME